VPFLDVKKAWLHSFLTSAIYECVCGELNMPGHFTSKSLVPARNLTQDRPTYSLVIISTTLPKFSVLVYMLSNAWVICPVTETPEFWQLQA